MNQLVNCHEHAKKVREEVQDSPIPFMPPTMLLFVDDEPKGVVLCKKTDEVTVSGMFAAIPAFLNLNSVVVTFEGYVRPIESASVLPIAEDPNSMPSVISLEVSKAGDSGCQISPYQIGDGGHLSWSEPGAVSSPAIKQIIDACHALFQMDCASHDLAHEVIEWLTLNGYNVNVSPTIVGCHEQTED